MAVDAMIQAPVSPVAPVAPQAPVAPAAPALPSTPGAGLSRDELREQIRTSIRETIRESVRGGNRRERDISLDQQIDQAVEAAVASATMAQGAQGEAVVTVPPWQNAEIPPQAVEISLAFFFTCAFIAVGLPLARAFARRMDRKTVPASPLPIETADRFTRIEQAIEAVAIEVERISEGQRYSTRLMSEMRGLPAPNPIEAWPATNEGREKERVEQRHVGDR